jgi:hypothetical protein
MIKINRVPNDDVYNVFLTVIIGFTLLIAIYSVVPYNHPSVYFIKNSSQKNNQV